MIVESSLKPYEILKGKLLGQIKDKEELNKELHSREERYEGYNGLWEKQVGVIQAQVEKQIRKEDYQKQKDEVVDTFFKDYLNAKLC